ncbi:MAG: phosphatase PAP2 family protein [Nitrospirae bacterium]|nr:phosphatase PAP2 family protein [Nitrospirota bacterium]
MMDKKSIIKKSAYILIPIIILFILFALDHQIRDFVKTNIKSAEWETFVQTLNKFGDGGVQAVIAIILMLAGYLKKNGRLLRTGKFGLFAIILAGIIVPRPTMTDTGASNLGPSITIGFDSFPSGHTASSFALAAILSSVYPKGRYIFYSLAGIASLSRIYLDSHFASDVFAGAVIGAWIGWLAYKRGKWQAT